MPTRSAISEYTRAWFWPIEPTPMTPTRIGAATGPRKRARDINAWRTRDALSKASYSPVPSVALSGVPMAVDPVCEKPVNPHNAFWMIWYKGTPYYFDTEECQLKFDHKPEHYRQLALDRRQKESIY
ncbi:MAG: YHS domain-containing protein [Methanobacteriota archaeon]|nr:MAG: YHS domain-containing protein [Euryarchaeota archaeon]